VYIFLFCNVQLKVILRKKKELGAVAHTVILLERLRSGGSWFEASLGKKFVRPPTPISINS
jgi:hypothetical protein